MSAARSNFFAVRDLDAFREEMDAFGLFQLMEDDQGRVCVLHEAPGVDWGDWPSYITDEEGEEEDIDFFEIVSGHLKDGEVAVFAHISNDKLRSIRGYALAVNSSGETRSVELRDIRDKARELGSSVDDSFP